MRKYLLALCCLLSVSLAYAKEYGSYDLKRLVMVSETPAGKKQGIDLAYLDRILSDLAVHARNYPPRFDTPQDQERAIQDVKKLSGMLDILIDVPKPNAQMLFRAGFLNSMGHNLDIPGSAKKTSVIFQKLLADEPSNPKANYSYGAFLAGAGKPKEALPYLEKALALGVKEADFSIGLVRLGLGDKEGALKNLEAYKLNVPDDKNVDQIIEAIRNGKIEVKTAPASS
ncbi:MAG: tetratricopeptide repeat protein [Azovibrio sp.]